MGQDLWVFLKDALTKLGRLHLTARRSVDGSLTGRHKSPFRGYSVEFAEHRPYFPGDDPRYLDWKALAKLDKLFVRQFEQETNLRCYILLDASGSMGYCSDTTSKLRYCMELSALLAYIVLRQGDAVGLAIFNQKLQTFLPARRSPHHLQTFLDSLSKVEANGQTKLHRVTEELSSLIKRRSLIVLLSDLLDEDETLPLTLHYLHKKGHDILVLHLLDPDELNLPFTMPSVFADMETYKRYPSDPETIRTNYQKRVEQFLRSCRKACWDSGAHYVLLTTDTSAPEALSFYLAWRAKHGNGYRAK